MDYTYRRERSAHECAVRKIGQVHCWTYMKSQGITCFILFYFFTTCLGSVQDRQHLMGLPKKIFFSMTTCSQNFFFALLRSWTVSQWTRIILCSSVNYISVNLHGIKKKGHGLKNVLVHLLFALIVWLSSFSLSHCFYWILMFTYACFHSKAQMYKIKALQYLPRQSRPSVIF